MIQCRFNLLVLLCSLVTAAPVAANWGRAFAHGQFAGEPRGLEHVTIIHESLRVDLRPLAEGEPVCVNAVYQIDNSGPGLDADLAFPIGVEAVSDFRVWFDDQSMNVVQSSKPEKLPDLWQPPLTTPGLNGSEGIPYLRDYGAADHYKLLMSSPRTRLTIPAGPHVLRTHYLARAAAHHSSQVTRYWQFAYILTPVRDWEGFQRLDVEVTLPEGWKVASVPQLNREGATLSGSFDGIPGDCLALTLQAPTPAYYWPKVYASSAALLLAVLVGPLWWWRAGQLCGRYFASSDHYSSVWRPLGALSILVLCSGAVLAWGLAVILLGWLAASCGIPAHQENYDVYSILVPGYLLLTLLACPMGLLVAWITAAFALRKEERLRLERGFVAD